MRYPGSNNFPATPCCLAILLVSVPLAMTWHQAACGEEKSAAAAESSSPPADMRTLSPTLDGKWIGTGISYGPYRIDQRPGGFGPLDREIDEDLTIMADHWQLLRMYGSGEVTERTLELIRDNDLPFRLMIGAWIAPEAASEKTSEEEAKGNRKANRDEVADVIHLAKEFPEQVVAINVGNETQVYWSGHKTAADVLIRYLREVRKATTVPVTTADDYNFWNKPESHAVANEIDFLVTHIHAMWAGLQPADAMKWTRKAYKEICEAHPNHLVVVGEAGWATEVHDHGEQAKLIKGEASERAQKLYYEGFTQWSRNEKVTTFFFEAFDEPWKGGRHPDEVEKHWGVYFEDRTPKMTMRGK